MCPAQRFRVSPALVLCLTTMIAAWGGAPAVVAQEAAGAPGPEPDQGTQARRMSLGAAVQLILARNPLSRAQELKVERARLDVEQFENFWYLPSFQLQTLTGVVPAARGDIFDSPDTASDLDNLGPFVRAQVGFALPIYTFGRLSNAANVARNVLGAEQAKAQKVRDELQLETIKAYWGLVASDEATQVATEMRDQYEKLLQEVEEKLDRDEIDPNDAWEIQAAAFDVNKTYLDAFEGRRLLERGLGEFLGLAPGEFIEPTDTEGPEVGLGSADLDRLVGTARRLNPDLRAVQSAVGALEAAMDLSRSNRWPIVLVGGFVGIAHSPVRDEQKNPFAFDEFNYRRVGAAFNLQWDLNFAKHRLEFLKRKIERDVTSAQQRALEMKISLDVYEALERVLKNVELVESAAETRRVSRRWLRTAFDDWDLGIGEAQPVIKAYQQDYRLQGLVIETQYLLNVSLAALAFVMGDLHSYLQWVADGQVVLD